MSCTTPEAGPRVVELLGALGEPKARQVERDAAQPTLCQLAEDLAI
jgi:hypothetical protein